MNIITGKHLSRRTMLQGLGAAIALPFLDAMTPAFAGTLGKVAATSPVRLSFVYVPNGIIMPAFTPATTGSDYAITRVLKPLEAFRNDMFVLSGLTDHSADPGEDGGGDHARAGATYLTGVRAKKTAGADIHVGVSADQIAAQALGSRTRLASLELGCDDSRSVGNCDSGYSCAYTNSISWRTPEMPMPPEINPRLVFERMFGGVDQQLDPQTRARRALYRRSVLDLVQQDTSRLVRTLGPSDRHKVDEYLTSVRELEQRIAKAEHESHPVAPHLDQPAGIPVVFADYLTLMYDLQIAAFQTDSTRVSTLMVGRETSSRVYPEIGVPDPHHPLTHHRNNPEWIEKVTKINEFHMGLFAAFIAKMKATPDGDGSLLDHTMVVYGSGISDGNRHSHSDLPVLLLGRGDGSLKPGRHIQYASGTPITNLHLTVLDRAGVRPESIGDSTGKVEHLTDLG